MKKNAWKILALLALAVSARADFFLWLDSPSRSNPNDRKSPFYHGASAVSVPIFVPSNTFTISPTFSVSQTFTLTPVLTATPSFSMSPTPSQTPPGASNGTWPTLTNFNLDITNNSAGGVNDVGWDGQDGCGPSASSASMASSNVSPFDATPFLRMTYNVALNAGCTYQYASVAFPFSTQNLVGMTSVDFAIRSTATVRLMIKTSAVDACLGSKNKMWIDIPSTGGAWQSISQSLSAMTIVNAGCPYPLNDVAFISFAIENVGSGTLDIDTISLGNTAPPSATPTPTPAGSNGAWPTLTTFNFDIAGNTASGVNSVGNDNDDGCGSSASSASVAASNASPLDATQFLRMTYNVALNASCTYQYASASFPMVTHDLVGMTTLDFAIRSTAVVRIMFRTAAVDACLGAKNKMWYDVPSTGGAWQSFSLPFSAFSLVNAGCPYPLNDTPFVAFNIENVGSGTVDLDNIAFSAVAPPSPTPSPTPLGSNGAWPALTNFNFDITGNNAGGVNSVGNDNDDGCGSSASSASVAASMASPFDATQFLRMTYNVALNASCTYQYASAAFPFSAQNLVGMTTLDFAIRSTASVRVLIRTTAVDGCLGVKNKMWFDVPSTGGAWLSVSQAFSGMNIVNVGCPYPLNDVAFVSFNIENVGSGTVDLDNIVFSSAVAATSTMTPTPPLITATHTPTIFDSFTATKTNTPSSPPTSTRTATITASRTMTNTPGAANTSTSTPTATPSRTFSSSPTPTPTATTAPASNGAWPTLSTFDLDIVNNNAGGVNDVGNDTQDGCGPSTSSASVAQSMAAPVNGTPFERMTYVVGINAGCGYQYASMSFPFVTHNLVGKTSIDFAIRSTATVRIMFRTVANDPCLGAKNKMWMDVASTGGVWQALNMPFSGFSITNAGCPYPLNDVAFVAFNIENPGSGTLDVDNISFP